MSKIFLGLLMLAVVLACAGPFFIKGPDGRPLLSLADLKDDLPEIPAFVTGDEKEDAIVTRVFKWQDDEGVWHFSNNPDDADGHEIVELDGDINLLPALGTENRDQSEEAPAVTLSIPRLMSVTPEQVSEMMETVTGIENALNERKRDIDRTTGQ